MNTTEGPGLSPERLDAIDAARPRLVRQNAPEALGVYTIVDLPPRELTPAEHAKKAAWCEEAATHLRAESAKEKSREQAAKLAALAEVYDRRVAEHCAKAIDHAAKAMQYEQIVADLRTQIEKAQRDNDYALAIALLERARHAMEAAEGHKRQAAKRGRP